MCVCVCVCVHAYVNACARVCVYVVMYLLRVRTHTNVIKHNFVDNGNASFRLGAFVIHHDISQSLCKQMFELGWFN